MPAEAIAAAVLSLVVGIAAFVASMNMRRKDGHAARKGREFDSYPRQAHPPQAWRLAACGPGAPDCFGSGARRFPASSLSSYGKSTPPLARS